MRIESNLHLTNFTEKILKHMDKVIPAQGKFINYLKQSEHKILLYIIIRMCL